jgi:hypothetical protein
MRRTLTRVSASCYRQPLPIRFALFINAALGRAIAGGGGGGVLAGLPRDGPAGHG